ncbi:chemotaxis-specific protein-glutamate methyltransferase CheB [Nocardioides flavescens]|uniref:Protein-glutamate methylesterase/protein-glutamine glutaminase n=1 Tax=Nocardioides flavescens TaxID=2691959 RepID=A0A6L7EWI9_9ACTN|nr:chemotaxis-specific protein-glutamate methyltransferase CheB [Nocardioides flavescens]
MSTIRVLVVDDSVVIRRLVSDVLAADPAIEVVGTAVNGRAAQAKAQQLRPDLITMDIEMPEMNGIEAVRALRASGSRVPIIMFSTLTERGAAATLDALSAGASDYVTKPANVGSVGRSMEQVREALIPRIKSLVPRPAGPAGRRTTPEAGRHLPAAAAPAAPVRLREPATPPPAGHRLLVIGSSTGGPEALTTLLGALPPLPVPVAIVQHMPPLFTRQFASRLDRMCPFPVREAEAGQVMAPGTVTIAPGDFHLTVVARGTDLMTKLDQGPAENFCRPAVDVLFRSAASLLGAQTLGLVLTGMGHDGRDGSRALVSAGASVLAQDEASSVVWGMPGAVARAGLAEQLLPVPALAQEIVRRLTSDAGPRARVAALAHGAAR